ncbi:MAG: hypothetical protein HOP02_15045 [Methylococcaceae bacterium]|nr:hypothetical protein [Methylococcaceae bacterium]
MLKSYSQLLTKLQQLLKFFIALSLLNPGVVTAAIPAQERAALIAIYNTLDSESLKFYPQYWSGWLGAEGAECSWSGVSCENNHVSAISFSDRHIYGTIPEAFSQLHYLKVLDLDSNQFKGEIPAWLSQLSNLKTLDLSRNQLSGAIPIALAQLSHLEVLNLYSNQLSGTIPDSLGQLNNLQQLLLVDNQLSGAIPDSLGQLNNLQQLVLAQNQLSGAIPDSLGQLNNLQYLILSKNQLTGTIPASLGQLSNLTTLALNNNGFSGTIPLEITNLTQLAILLLDKNRLSSDNSTVTAFINNHDCLVESNCALGVELLDPTKINSSDWGTGITLSGKPTQARFISRAVNHPLLAETAYTTVFQNDYNDYVSAAIRIAPEQQGRSGSIYIVVHYKDAWYMKSPQGWENWDTNVATLKASGAAHTLHSIEGIKITEQLSGLTGSFEVYIGYKVDDDIHYNAKPFTFTVSP